MKILSSKSNLVRSYKQRVAGCWEAIWVFCSLSTKNYVSSVCQSESESVLSVERGRSQLPGPTDQDCVCVRRSISEHPEIISDFPGQSAPAARTAMSQQCQIFRYRADTVDIQSIVNIYAQCLQSAYPHKKISFCKGLGRKEYIGGFLQLSRSFLMK